MIRPWLWLSAVLLSLSLSSGRLVSLEQRPAEVPLVLRAGGLEPAEEVPQRGVCVGAAFECPAGAKDVPGERA